MKVAATKLQISTTTTKNYYLYKVCAPHNKKKEAKKTVRFVTIVAVMTAFYILILVLVLVLIRTGTGTGLVLDWYWTGTGLVQVPVRYVTLRKKVPGECVLAFF